jgi:hypothetical protein
VYPITNLIIYEDDLSRIVACLNMLNRKARSRAVLLIDKSGQLIACAGETDGLDATSLGSLAAGAYCSCRGSGPAPRGRGVYFRLPRGGAEPSSFLDHRGPRDPHDRG